MRELITNAWLGWHHYTDQGKVVALFLASLLFLWLWKKETRERYFYLLLYAAVLAVCCICPVTAALLMKYQTKFYDYQWIWSMVPVTLVTALAGTLVWQAAIGPAGVKGKNFFWRAVGVTALMLSLLYVCGSMQQRVWDADGEMENRRKTEEVLEILTENGQNKDITLWAPRAVMEYARALDGQIRLPYGRNMWDATLNAYSYDAYGGAQQTLYEWMSYLEETGTVCMETQMLKSGEEEGEKGREGSSDITEITPQDCLEIAKDLGVNCILIPSALSPEMLLELEAVFGTEAEAVSEFYVFWIA